MKAGAKMTQIGECIVDGCEEPQKSLHLCQRHYGQIAEYKRLAVLVAQPITYEPRHEAARRRMKDILDTFGLLLPELLSSPYKRT